MEIKLLNNGKCCIKKDNRYVYKNKLMTSKCRKIIACKPHAL